MTSTYDAMVSGMSKELIALMPALVNENPQMVRPWTLGVGKRGIPSAGA